MIKNKFKKFVLSLVVIAGSLDADSSLIGIDAGYSSMNSEQSTSANPNIYSQDTTALTNLGLKLGAESEDYRVFLSGRYYFDAQNKYEYIMTYGVEFQYLFNLSSKANIYIGVNTGIMNVKYSIPSESFSRTLSDPYYGGDIGVHFKMNKSPDLDIGLRIISVQADNIKNNVTYRLKTIATIYASLIFNWDID